MSSQFIELSRGKIHAHCFGQGKNLLIALHGYGDNGQVFSGLESALNDHFRVYAVDLPFHGTTAWRAPDYDADDLEELVAAILEREKQVYFKWLGYSYGGRLILSTLARFAGRADAAFLVAPDGLGTRGMRLPLLTPPALRRPLALWLEKSQWPLALARFLRQSRLLNAYSYYFLRHQLSSHRRRRRLSGTWRSLRHFPVRLPAIRRQLSNSKMKLYLLGGTADKLIHPDRVRAISNSLPGVEFHLIKGEHDQLIAPELGKWVVAKDGSSPVEPDD